MISEQTLVMLYSLADGKKIFLKVEAGRRFSTLHGEIAHDAVREAGFGGRLTSHIGREFLVLRPSLYDLMMNLPRPTQVVYPKDAGYILLKLGIREGDTVLEAGTGSGMLTLALAYSVGSGGRVVTYEKREDIAEKARSNLEVAGIRDRVELKLGDVETRPFDESGADAIFFDIKGPSESVRYAAQALRPGGAMALILPTINQVLYVMKRIEEERFIDMEVTELMIRHYKLNAERFRPEDRMVGHTGYLVFCRKSLGG